MWKWVLYLWVLGISAAACKKGSDGPPPPAGPYVVNKVTVDGTVVGSSLVYNVNTSPAIRFSFSQPIDPASVSGNFFIKKNGIAQPFTSSMENNDSTVAIRPSPALDYIVKYDVNVSTALKSKGNGQLQGALAFAMLTKIDSSRKFPLISDDSLLTLVQKQTFKYFWDFGHPVSGLARERNSSGETVTSGGSGFGIMTIPVAINRGFITRAEGLERMQKIVGFLKNTAQRFHGAFSHWLHGTNGAALPFSAKDDAADLVETSYLIQGLLCARQYFNGIDAAETQLRTDINSIWNAVEWDWFRQNNQEVLYWHWSPTYTWQMNHPIKGWNESLITYVLAASSTTHSIPKSVYTAGWASNGGMVNGNTYLGYTLPLGPEKGGPLFFAHYSFLGIDPNNLTDQYAAYFTQNRNHTLINYNHCIANPGKYFGYSDSCWGLTASDINNGYNASSPTNDVGVIAPTAALSSFPYTPAESMKALKFFYYVLGNKIWRDYGFVDAFSLHQPWFADSYLAIDQGPIIVMIENYRSGLLWDLFMSCPEVKTGMKNLGFQGPDL